MFSCGGGKDGHGLLIAMQQPMLLYRLSIAPICDNEGQVEKLILRGLVVTAQHEQKHLKSKITLSSPRKLLKLVSVLRCSYCTVIFQVYLALKQRICVDSR